MRAERALLVLALAVACTGPQPAMDTPSPARSEPVSTAAASATPVAAQCPPFRPILTGAISGLFGYPAEGSPPLALIAVRVDDPSRFRVVHTPRIGPGQGATSYTIAALEPGTYVVLAYVVGTATGALIGAYTPAVACGLTVACTDHSLIRVAVRAGETVRGIDVRDWYAPPGTFPPRPAGSEPFRAGDGLRVCNPYADSVNVRASVGLTFPVRRTLDNGAAVVVRDGPLGADGYDWYEVDVAAGRGGDQPVSGWVVGYALRK